MNIAVTFLAFTLASAGQFAQGQTQSASIPAPPAATRPSGLLQPKIAPGLARYTDEVLFGQVWPSSDLSPRDRSLIVISALIAMNRPAQLTGHLNRALTNGVTPVEASGVLTHLALYAGWPNAVSALTVYEEVYTSRGIDFAALQAPVPTLPPLAFDTKRPRRDADQVAIFAPKFADLTNDIVFGDLWRRADLTRRDRALVTIAALTAMGDDTLLEQYLRVGRASGLRREEVAEALTHLAFYAGWPKATKALKQAARVLPPVR
ncbi:4-carboxymuconolactone decarboxylase [Acidovorax soli]|uniref:4-carboxymuconolactone decarboxylase n=1 Tax=Acidovorax soli TaxID=592050 RepID=A0A7X0P918_9BURK|nr:carboxymuconolactone decarboxylase family protein [Acidovorax soli]MBB6557486.1 4-carboxymuconolactone decarboxylase [Acidovorax soli]